MHTFLTTLAVLLTACSGYVLDSEVGATAEPLVSCPRGDTLARAKLVAEWGCLWSDETHAYGCGGDDVRVELLPVYDDGPDGDGGLLAGHYEVESRGKHGKLKPRVIATLNCTCTGEYACSILYQ